MGKSQQTFNKKEREKKKQKKRKDKLAKREQRKLEKAEKGKLTFEEQIMYVDHDGTLTSEKPDPTKKFTIKVEDVKLGVPQYERESLNPIKRGKVKFFNEEKGYGFITEKITKDSIFVHANDAYSDIKENHIVQFEVGVGNKGAKAINVIQIKNTPGSNSNPTPSK